MVAHRPFETPKIPPPHPNLLLFNEIFFTEMLEFPVDKGIFEVFPPPHMMSKSCKVQYEMMFLSFVCAGLAMACKLYAFRCFK